MLITAEADCPRVCARIRYSFPQQLHLHNRILYLFFSACVYPPLPGAVDNEDRAPFVSQFYRWAFGRRDLSSACCQMYRMWYDLYSNVPLLDEILKLEFMLIYEKYMGSW